MKVTLVRTRTAEIFQVEGLIIVPMRGSSEIAMTEQSQLGPYRWKHKADSKMTIAKWKKDRFQKCYPGFNCVILDVNKDEIHGNTLLKNARAN